MQKFSKLITWPVAAVIIAGGAVFALIWVFADEESKAALIGANGLVWLIVRELIRSGGESGPPPPPALLALLALVFAVGVTLPACGPGAAQTAISAQASVIVSTRPARIDFYEAEHARCPDASDSLGAYDTCMAPSRHIARAADSYRESLFAAQAAINAGNGGDVIACAIEGARRLVEALRSANVPVPQEVANVANLLPEMSCHAE